MTAVERMRKYLKEEFGIENDAQLEAALSKVKPLNISAMVTEVKKDVKAIE